VKNKEGKRVVLTKKNPMYLKEKRLKMKNESRSDSKVRRDKCRQ